MVYKFKPVIAIKSLFKKAKEVGKNYAYWVAGTFCLSASNLHAAGGSPLTDSVNSASGLVKAIVLLVLGICALVGVVLVFKAIASMTNKQSQETAGDQWKMALGGMALVAIPAIMAMALTEFGVDDTSNDAMDSSIFG